MFLKQLKFLQLLYYISVVTHKTLYRSTAK